MDISLVKRTRGSHDTEDLALTFMEEEVGRFDWQNNWKKLKATGNARDRIKTWLEALSIDHCPDEIIEYLDRTAGDRSGSWR